MSVCVCMYIYVSVFVCVSALIAIYGDSLENSISPTALAMVTCKHRESLLSIPVRRFLSLMLTGVLEELVAQAQVHGN